ncbi:hypothetical protein RUM44_012127 [Polyplax serrata]|uniref:Uncharacterized protein n=1 Tax=Polyplax serrata TaxID=468196 RepID=A0ABR1BFB7_POLSC
MRSLTRKIFWISPNPTELSLWIRTHPTAKPSASCHSVVKRSIGEISEPEGFGSHLELIKALGIDNPEEEHQWSVPEKQVEFFVLPIKLNYKNSYFRTSLLVNEANTKILKSSSTARQMPDGSVSHAVNKNYEEKAVPWINPRIIAKVTYKIHTNQLYIG